MIIKTMYKIVWYTMQQQNGSINAILLGIVAYIDDICSTYVIFHLGFDCLVFA